MFQPIKTSSATAPFSDGPEGRVFLQNGAHTARPSGPPLSRLLQSNRVSAFQKRAYTLIEVLIVAVIIVLMLGMALPVFRAITGSRSEAGATNQIAAMLGRARTDAIGLQQNIGVAFISSPSTQLTYMAEVEFPSCPVWISGGIVPPLGYCQTVISGISYYFINNGMSLDPVNNTFSVTLKTAPTAYNSNPQAGIFMVGGPPIEVRPDTELLPLPMGIGVQTLCNSTFSTTLPYPRISDGYLSFGVVLFDANGRMTSQNYGASQYSKLVATVQPGLGNDYPKVSPSPGNLIYNGSTLGVVSQYGLVVFQTDPFASTKSSARDSLYVDPTPAFSANMPLGLVDYASSGQKTEEDWLDQNATPLLIDRYTGTLIRAE